MPTDQNLDQIAAITTLAAGDQFYVETAGGADGRATASQIKEFSIKGTLGTQVKVVGVDGDGTIQSCINLCTSASSTNPFTVLIPPKAGNYVEPLTLKGSVALVGMTNALNSDAIQIEGSHTYTPDLASASSNRIGFENLTFVSASLTANTISVVAGTGGLKYASQLRFLGCVFSGGKNSGVSHISTCDNVSLYIDNCRFESSTGNAGSAGITQGNGPLYLSNNVVFDVVGRALDVPASTTVTKTATSTTGSTTLTVSDVTSLAVGQKISGTGIYSTTTVVSITAPSTVVMSSPPQTATSGFDATFGQTPYVEIHDSVLAGKGAEVIRLGNGLMTGSNSNITNYASGGSGINLRVAGTTVGLVNSSFTIYDTNAYTVTTEATGSLPANAAYAAFNSVSYSNITGVPAAAYSTLTGANVIVLDYASRTARQADIQTFTSSGAWIKPSGAKSVHVICISGGGGGGSGKKTAGSSVNGAGGGGGGGGAYSFKTLNAAILAAAETVTIGAGGLGGASQTTNSTAGIAGQNGSNSSFGSSPIYCFAGKQSSVIGYGSGGSTTAGNGGAGSAYGYFAGGAAGVGTTGNGTDAGSSSGGASGGGGGGGITAPNTLGLGGKGGYNNLNGLLSGVSGGLTDGAAGTVGASYASLVMPGQGGGGGAASVVTNGSGGAGANGGSYGGGGGGGGATIDGTGSSGKGGDGAAGVVQIITYF